ncbi:hypothetical protein [Bosea sp. (in: a-proteobacteria)]|jgi:hypothetical protein|uniref:hypothetical protein n=1 Tax=Bosea sp. (in: a-proteobacteria) TaxID=1871050 RepID=UPI002DDD3D0A|nr:hypothetical protein [Bosea sp. (in: a-proteobacteria)]HEV2510629.1 hypothetical protein [Bosea sp. (in: a-proteobacteria)]
MTTKKQINRLLGELLERNPDLAQSERFVIVKPLRHVMRSISIGRGIEADGPQFLCSIGHFFDPRANRQGITLDRFFTAHGAPHRWTEPGMHAAFIEACETRILPKMRNVNTIEDMLRFRTHGSSEFRASVRFVIHQIHFAAAYGRFERALRRFERIKHWDRSRMSWRRPEFEHVADELVPLMRADDRDGVIRLLHHWEEDRVRRFGLESIYEPTPFPLELAAGA